MKLEDCTPGVRVMIYQSDWSSPGEIICITDFNKKTLVSVSHSGHASLFHHKQLRRLKPKKKKVKKTIERWINIYKDGTEGCPHLTKDMAEVHQQATKSRIAIVRLVGEYECEE